MGEMPEWRRVGIRFDIEAHSVDVKVGGEMVIEGFHLGAIKIPNNICIGVCGATSADKHAHLCVNDIVLIDEDDEGEEVGLDVSLNVKGPSLDVKMPSCEVSLDVKGPSCEVGLDVSLDVKAPSLDVKMPSCEVSLDVKGPSCEVGLDVSLDVKAPSLD